jgi:hypothetical protein
LDCSARLPEKGAVPTVCFDAPRSDHDPILYDHKPDANETMIPFAGIVTRKGSHENSCHHTRRVVYETEARAHRAVISHVYFAVRLLRVGARVLICPVPIATAKSGIGRVHRFARAVRHDRGPKRQLVA